MSLNSNALITVNEYLANVGNTQSPTPAENARIEQAINWASTLVESHLSRTLISGSLATEIFDGRGYNQRYETIHTEQKTLEAPITGNPQLYHYDGSTWTAVTSTIEYTSGEFHEGGGVIYFPGVETGRTVPLQGNLGTTGNYFEAGRRNYKLIYDYGYANAVAIPTDIKWATAMIVQHFIDMAEHQGKASETIGTQTFAFNNRIPKTALDILSKYKR